MIHRRFLADEAPTFESLVSAADQRLFKAITADQCHVLHRYLLNLKHTGHKLRPRAHDYTSCLTKTTTNLLSGYTLQDHLLQEFLTFELLIRDVSKARERNTMLCY